MLCDSTGAPVRDARMRVEARQVAHASDVLRATLEPHEAGVYAARLPMARTGLWELRVVATRGTDLFTADVRMDASATSVGRVITERPGDAPPARVDAGVQDAAR